ncbi:MAG TPA: hypothetical protein VHQ90_20680 [Thermoanaerobaculia bacterium]|nr:hypothetical protein [Thermoanaerobaculia bacterium]
MSNSEKPRNRNQWVHSPDIRNILVNRWPSLRLLSDKPELPAAPLLLEILECAHSASLTREEGRTIAFRLLLVPSLPGLARICSEHGMTLVGFDQPRDLTAQELRRLAPATDPSTTMIVIEFDNPPGAGRLSIRGLTSIGSEWREFNAGRRLSGTLPPSLLMVSVSGPGSVRFECAGLPIIGMEQGRLLSDAQNVLRQGPVSEFLLPALMEYSGKNLNPSDWSEFYGATSNYLRFLAWVLHLCRDQQHGGMFLLLRRSADARGLVTIKYPCRFEEPWRLLLKVEDCLREAFAQGQQEAESLKKRRQLDSAYREAEDVAHLIARLASVDGCVVLNDRLDVLGFGAIVAPGTDAVPEEIFVCSEPTGEAAEGHKADGYGTRHRSAFRVCAATEDALAFVLSQDGGVKAITRRGSRVLVFENVALDGRAWSSSPPLEDIFRKQGG